MNLPLLALFLISISLMRLPHPFSLPIRRFLFYLVYINDGMRQRSKRQNPASGAL
jgi:hypothetical protein